MQKHKNFSLAFITISFFSFLLLSYQKSYAIGATGAFGGKITATTATEINIVQKLNYHCFVAGSTINISPVGGAPSSYYIPSYVKSKTKTSALVGENILGLYSKVPTPIICVFQGYPVTVIPVFLPTVTLWGTSS